MKTALALVAAILLLPWHPARSQHCIRYQDYLHQFAAIETMADGIATDGRHLAALFYSNLTLYDVSDPRAPYWVDSVVLGPGRHALAMTDGLIATASGENDPSIYHCALIDITDPTAMHLLGQVELPGPARDIALAGDRALVACGSAGLVVVAISDPTAPVIVGSLALTPAVGVDCTETRGFLATADGLHLLDLSAAGLPALLGSLPIPGGANDVAGKDQSALVAGGSGLRVVDCSDPAQPALRGLATLPEAPSRVATDGALAFLALPSRGLAVVDLADPWAPAHTGTILAACPATAVANAGTTVFLASLDLAPAELPGREIMIIDAANPYSPPAIGALDLGVAVHDLCVVGPAAFVLADHPEGTGKALITVEVTQPDQPHEVGRLEVPAEVVQLAALSDCLILGLAGGKLGAVDATDPAQLAWISEIELSAPLNTFVTAFGHAIAGVGVYTSGALQTVAFTDPGAPEVVYETDFGRADAMAVGGSCLLFAGLHGLMHPQFMLGTADITDPAHWQGGGMTYLGELAPTRLAADGDHAVLECCGWEEWPSAPLVRVYDLGDCTTPQLTGSTHLARWSGGLAVVDGVVYAGVGDGPGRGALQVLAIGNPTGLTRLGQAATGAATGSVCVQGSLVYALVAPSILQIRPAQCGEVTAVDEPAAPPAAARLDLAIRPNPCNPRTAVSFRLDRTADVEAAVHRIDGARVAWLARGRFAAGEHTIVWAGRDDEGHILGSGVYLVRIVAGAVTATEKLVLVR